MFFRRHNFLWSLLLVLPLLFAVGCSDDDNGGTQPTGSDEPPLLVTPTVPTNVTVGNATAEAIVEGQLAMAQGMASFATAFTAPANNADWDDVGGCFSYTVSYQACTWTYRVCELTSGYEWTLTLDGACDGTTYANWVAMRITTNANGTEGTLRIYGQNTATVEFAAAWTSTATSGTWTYYEGDINASNVAAIMAWTQNTDGSSDWTYTVPADMKWETHISGDGASGYWRLYEWNGTAWWLTSQILWDADGGSYTTYDEQGGIVSQETWGDAGDDPICQVSTMTLDFETVTIGQSATLSYTISNSGGGTLTGSVGPGCDDFQIIQGSGSFSLAAGASHTVTIAFAPSISGYQSCSIDNGTACENVLAFGLGSTGADEPELPDTPIPDVSLIDIGNTLAQGTVAGSAQIIASLVGFGTAFTNPANGADWDDLGGGCWEYELTEAGCTWTYEVCLDGTDFVWIITLNGTCDSGSYSNWVAVRITVNEDGTQGTFVMYEQNSTTVAFTLAWTSNATSGTWTLYSGTQSQSNLIGIMTWVDNGDGTEEWTWTIPEMTRWEMQLSSSGTSGWYKAYYWDDDGQVWWLRTEITWMINGTGTMTTYDEEGAVEDEESW
ncbi:MAG: hypothetical protein KJ970_14920 [Candidatus Eisenbacteria bacterium]|uniref:Choice-of-anchor D domain-containing protein n=1 Tax=Eiseniibacteriota bacterium TaxID=2212470 RepID=A0A948W4H2_UNCEI|nr:hypothetical protein [Candidatus Eisenbacteria bacterium]MBU1948759.1 hypothetical protein [Candidatus Eisenbacteria bacterium]MBU2692212.1 hypothetical protein [Candidatus Eisenbacteria bacterium]